MRRRGWTSRWPRRLLASGVGGMVLVGVEYYLLGSLAYDATAAPISAARDGLPTAEVVPASA